MHVLIAVPQQDPATGNWVTARRFAEELSTRGAQVTLQGAPVEDPSGLRATLEDSRPDVAILLHAYRSGRPWLAAQQTTTIPYLVLLTGTDINNGFHDPKQRDVIKQTLSGAQAILLQNRLLIETFDQAHPALRSKLHYLPPDIRLGNLPCDLRAKLSLHPEAVLLFCPASIRPVKSVLELLRACDPLAGQGLPFHLAFCGPILDQDYGQSFLDAVSARDWASYLGVIDPEAMAAALQSADLVINNSQHEGLSNALLEAAAVGTPILARNIAGNAALVESGVNGRLFDDASFLDVVASLIGDPVLRARLSETRHPVSPGQEGDRLFTLVRDVLGG